MRIIGVDYGQKRTGLAITDEMMMMAHPLRTVPSSIAIQEIKKVISEYSASKIIVGMPYNLKGETAFKAKETQAWIDRLKAEVNIPVESYDERFTTSAAEAVLIEADVSRKKRDKVIDKLAACNILQNYMNQVKSDEQEKK